MAKSESEIWFDSRWGKILPCHWKGWVCFGIFLTLVFGVILGQEFVESLKPHSALERWGPLGLLVGAYYVVYLLRSG